MDYGMGPGFGPGPQFGGQFCGPTGFGPSAGFGAAGWNYPGFGPGNFMPSTNWGGGYGFTPPANAWPGPYLQGWGLGGGRTWGGTYSPQFLSTGLPTDSEIVEMIYDAMDDDPVVPFDADINVDSNAGTVTLTGTVHSKLVKHAVGDDAWWIPGVDDVQNNLQVVSRRVTPSGGRPAPAKREAPVPAATTRPTRKATPSTGQIAPSTATRAGGQAATGARGTSR